MTPAISLPGRRLATLLLAVASLASCATAGAADGEERTRGTANLIIAAELEPLHQLNARQAIERLRPNWLRSRLGRTPVVVVEGNPGQSVQILESIRAPDVTEMRFLSARDATTRYGTGYDGGAIEISLQRGR